MEKDIDRIAKNPDVDIVIRIDDYGGKRGLTIREFIRGERYTGFTKNGTRVPAEKFAQFKTAINSIDEKELLEAALEEVSGVSQVDKEKEQKQEKTKKQKQAQETLTEEQVEEETF